MNGPMGLKMSEQEQGLYLQAIFDRKVELEGPEIVMAEELRRLHGELEKVEKHVASLREELTKSIEVLQRITGARQSCAKMLLEIEEGRQNEKIVRGGAT